MGMTSIELLQKPRWKRVPVSGPDGTIIPGIQCDNLNPQQVKWVGQALRTLGLQLVTDSKGNGVVPVGQLPTPTGVTVAGKENLRKLADAGLNFAGSSDFLSPELE